MKHKFSIFFKINAWLCILTGLVLIVLSLQNNTSTNSSLAVSAFYCAATLFIIDYVIQILFDCRNYLRQLTNQSGINNNSKHDIYRQDFSKEPDNRIEFRESIWKKRIGDGVDWGTWFVAIVILLAIILIAIKK